MLPRRGGKSYIVGHLNINNNDTILYYKNLNKVSFRFFRLSENPDKQRVCSGWR